MSDKSRIILFLWTILISITFIIWTFRNTVPPAWDQANYLEASEVLYQSLKIDGFWKFVDNTTLVLGRKAPLLPVVTVPLYVVFSSSPQIALLINILFFLLFVFFYFQLARIFVAERIAVGAVLIISTMPLFYGLMRNYFVEFGLMAMVTLFIYLLLRTEGFTNRSFVFLLGVVFGFGMLMKLHFFLFIAGPFVVVAYEQFKKLKLPEFYKLILDKFFYFIIPACVIALPWYSRNILTVLWHAKRATSPQLLGDVYYGPFYSLGNIAGSLDDFVNFSIGGYWFIVFSLLAVNLALRKKRLRVNYFFTLWFLVPFFIFLFGPNKDYRLFLPALPPLALFLSWLLWTGFERLRSINFVFLMIIPSIIYLNSVFPKSFFIDNIRLGPILISDKKIGNYVEKPKNEKWPSVEVLKFLDEMEPAGEKKVIILASENTYFNINNLRYFARKYLLNLEIKTASYFSIDTQPEKILEFASTGDYLILKIGGEAGPLQLNYFNHQIESTVLTENGRSWQAVNNSFVFPDGGKLLIAKRI